MTEFNPRFRPRQSGAPIPHTLEHSPDFMALIRTLWRGKLVIAGSIIVAVTLTTYYVFAIATAHFSASTVVILDTRQASVVELPSVIGAVSGETSSVNSEVEVLRARTLMTRVAEDLNLMSDPEFNADLRKPGLKTRVRAGLESLTGSRQNATPPKSESEQLGRDKDRIVSVLLSKLIVRNVPNSHVFRISATTQDPEKSARITDAVADNYIRQQMRDKQDATEQAITWLTDRVAELQAQLESAEAHVARFTASTELVSAPALQFLERQLKEARARTATTRSQIKEARVREQRLLDAKTPSDRAEVASDVLLTQMVGPDGTRPFDKTEFENRYDDITAKAQTDVVRLVQQRQALLTSETELELQIAQQSQDLIALQQLSREAAATRLLYEHFLSRLKETSAQLGIQSPDSRVLSHAVVSSFPQSPRKSLLITMAALFGLVGGIIFVLVKKRCKKTFVTAAEVEAFTNLPVLAMIPARRGAIRIASSDHAALGHLRTSLLLSNIKTSPQVMLATSASQDEGRSLLARCLGQVFHDADKKVLLIEAHASQTQENTVSDNRPEIGLEAILNGSSEIDAAIYRPAGCAVDVIATIRENAISPELFLSRSFHDLMQILRQRYDYIVIDTPPVLVDPNARVLAQFADAVLLAVEWDSTDEISLQEALRVLKISNVPVSGIVLTQVNDDSMTYFGHGRGRRFHSEVEYETAAA